MGSIRELVSSSGTILTRYGYDPYGRTSTSYLSGSVDATKQYEGMYLHQPSGLNLTRGGDGISTGRPYDSNTGRWLSRDPIAERGGINLYEFVLDDPTDHNDPFGLFRDCDAENIACFRKCYAKRAPWPVECKEYTPAQNKAFRYIWCEKKCNAEMMECKAANAAEAAGDAAKAVVQWCQKNPVLCAGGAVIIIGARPNSGAPLVRGERFWVRESDLAEGGKRGAL